MTDQDKIEIIDILEMHKGDDLYRAQAAFKGRSPTEMQLEHGQSGKTCQQILDGYKQHVQRVNELQEAVRRA